MGFFSRLFKRRDWNNAGVSVSKQELLNILLEQTAGLCPRIGMRDGKKPLRLLSDDEFKALCLARWKKYGDLPAYNLEDMDCDDIHDVWAGQMKERWRTLAHCGEALGFGYTHIRREGNTTNHWTGWRVSSDRKLFILESAREDTYPHAIERMWKIGQ